ncbi:MAG: TIGR03905 family TSCPD domain-containing protein [Deltaproteobacteria bacterium]|nr:TIGR03905 family TSCPD domain-containing protein [Deltaproteobacteria bacterium]
MPDPQRYIYRTQGVCPSEIHFRIEDELLREVRFVGGGCPGNAQLVSRLLKDQPLERFADFLDGIECKNKTSCPDQLSKALKKVQQGELLPARSFRIVADTQPRKHLALVGDLDGKVEVWKALSAEFKKLGIEAAYCLGNLIGSSQGTNDLLRVLRKERHLLAIQGERDWTAAGEVGKGSTDSLGEKEKAYLSGLGQVVSFQLGNRKGLGFFGQYLQDLPDYSDFEPYALEMNMVVNLTRFMQDETVFPALETMIPQFSVQVIVFSQIQKWGHWQKNGVDFISLGPAFQGDKLAWGILEERTGRLHFRVEERPWPSGA